MLDLNSLPRGAKTAAACNLALTLDADAALNIDLFKARRLKGWWPFMAKNELGQFELTVCICL